MTVQAPELISPVIKGALASGSVVSGDFRWRFRTSTVGASSDTWAIRRRRLFPTVGTYEYWNAGLPGWQAGEVFNAGGLTTVSEADVVIGKDRTQYYIGSNFPTFTNGEKYQIAVAHKESGSGTIVYCRDHLVDVHARPTLTGGATTPTSATKPKISWSSTMASASLYQLAYQWCIQTGTGDISSTLNIQVPTAGFANGFEASKATLFWYMNDPVFDSQDFFVRPTVNLNQGTTYSIYGRVFDASGLSSQWIKVGQVAISSVVAQTPSFVSQTVDTVTGAHKTVWRIPTNQATGGDFSSGIGNYKRVVNCELSVVPLTNPAVPSPTSGPHTGNMLLVEIGGVSYDEMNALHASYTAQDTAYASYNAEEAIKASPTDRSVFNSGQTPTTSTMFPVTPAVLYRVSFWAFKESGGTSRAGTFQINWWKSDGSASTTPASATTAMSISSAWNLFNSTTAGLTAPADAAFATIQWDITDDVHDERFGFTSIVFARNDAPEWSQTGGFTPYLIAENSYDGTHWEYVWGASPESPLTPDNPNGDLFTVIDRTWPRGIQQPRFRVQAVSGAETASTELSYSSLVSGVTVMSNLPSGVWIRDTGELITDVKVYVATVQKSKDQRNTTFLPDGRTYPIVITESGPKVETFNLKFQVLDAASIQLVQDILSSGRPFFFHSFNHWDSRYMLPISDWQTNPIRAARVSSETYRNNRAAMEFSLQAVSVGKPEFV